MEQAELRAPVLREGLQFRPLVEGRVFVYHPRAASEILDARVGEALKLCRGQSLAEMLPEVRVVLDYDCTPEEWQSFLDRMARNGVFEGTSNRTPRLRLFDPGPAIDFLTQNCRWLFTAPAVVVLFLLLIAGLGRLFAHWSFFTSEVLRVASTHPLLSMLLFYFCFVPVGLLHELAHGMVCRWFGGEVVEVGLWTDRANLYVSSNKTPLTTPRARILYLSGGVFLDMFMLFLMVNIWLAWPNYITLMFLLPQALFFVQFSYATEKGSDLSRIIAEWTEIPEPEGRWGFLKEFSKERPVTGLGWRRASIYLGSIALQGAVAVFLIWTFRRPVPVSLWPGLQFSVAFWPPILYLTYRSLRKASLKIFPQSA
jgi:hypothetical protein